MMANRWYTLIAVGAMLCSSGHAQVKLGPQGVARSQQIARPGFSEVRELSFIVDAAPEPDPPLKYSLRTALSQKKSGNAAPFYYRAFWMMEGTARQTDWAALTEYLDKPLVELREQNVGQQLKPFQSVFREVRTASLRERCDWDWRMQDLDGMDAIEFLLPEVQQARDVARLLALQARVQISEGRYEQAIETLRQGYQLASDTGRPRSLVSCLVGIAISAIMNEQIIQLIQSDDAPNLYWALAELPKPLISVRESLELELNWPNKIFPFLENAESVNRSPEEWRRLFHEAADRLGKLYETAGDSNLSELAITGLMMCGYARAMERLSEEGFARQQLEEMAAVQVIAIYQSRVNRRIRDGILKWTLLPYDQAWKQQRQSDVMLVRQGRFGVFSEYGEVIPIASLLFPALSASRRAEARSWSHLSFLQTVEAIRMHAAENDGELPDRLDQITVVPTPRDPLTLKAFPYRRVGEEAILEIPAEPDRHDAGRWRFSIRVRRP